MFYVTYISRKIYSNAPRNPPSPLGCLGAKTQPILNQNLCTIELESKQNRARRLHKSSGWPRDGLRRANLATKTPKWNPTWPQDDHKKAPRQAQERSWGYLGASWESLGGVLEASWEPFGHIFEGSLQF